jgi:hypothetical protein
MNDSYISVWIKYCTKSKIVSKCEIEFFSILYAFSIIYCRLFIYFFRELSNPNKDERMK